MIDTTEEGILENEINLEYYNLTLSIPIEIIVTKCIIESLEFETASNSVEYKIGIGLISESLPGIK